MHNWVYLIAQGRFYRTIYISCDIDINWKTELVNWILNFQMSRKQQRKIFLYPYFFRCFILFNDLIRFYLLDFIKRQYFFPINDQAGFLSLSNINAWILNNGIFSSATSLIIDLSASIGGQMFRNWGRIL